MSEFTLFSLLACHQGEDALPGRAGVGCSYAAVLGGLAQALGFFRASPAHFHVQSALVSGGSEILFCPDH